jgi:NAD(P)H-flavin reductase
MVRGSLGRSPAHLAYRTELDRLTEIHRLVEVIHTVSEPDRGWSGPTGRIDVPSPSQRGRPAQEADVLPRQGRP